MRFVWHVIVVEVPVEAGLTCVFQNRKELLLHTQQDVEADEEEEAGPLLPHPTGESPLQPPPTGGGFRRRIWHSLFPPVGGIEGGRLPQLGEVGGGYHLSIQCSLIGQPLGGEAVIEIVVDGVQLRP